MKESFMFTKYFTLIGLLAPVVGYGDGLNLLTGKIGAVYSSPSPTEIEMQGERHFDSDRFPKVKRCHNAKEFIANIEFGFMAYAVKSVYPAQSPFFDRDVDFNLFDSNDVSCNWNDAAILTDLKKVHASLLSTQKFLILESLSAEGTAIRARVVYSGAGIREIAASGKSEIDVLFKLKLEECMTEDGERISTFIENDRATDLYSIITNLRRRGYRTFRRCNLTIGDVTLGGDIAKGGGSYLPRSSGLTISILKDNPNLFKTSRGRSSDSKETLLEEYVSQVDKIDPGAEGRAITAAKQLVQFIADDYGDLLYDLSEKKNIQEAEKREVIRAFFEKHKTQILDWFRTIDDNYAYVSLSNKISMMISIRDMYRTISAIEQTVSRSSINLDRVIRSYQK
jgi:hypothetical protein